MKPKLFSIFLIITIALTSCGKKTTGADVVAAFKAVGLEAENISAMTADNYGPAPYVCTGTRFLIPSLGIDNGGRIFVCDNTKDRDALENYYKKMGESSALFFSWVFVKNNIVVQINGDLPEDKARQYEAAIP